MGIGTGNTGNIGNNSICFLFQLSCGDGFDFEAGALGDGDDLDSGAATARGGRDVNGKAGGGIQRGGSGGREEGEESGAGTGHI